MLTGHNTDILEKIKQKEKVDESATTLNESLKMIRNSLDDLIQMQASLSIIYKARFDALVEIGFTKQQALEIVKARGMNP